jgi:hypothetical protein
MSDDVCEIPERTGSDEAPQRLRYRLLTGAGDRAFCERISAALDDGYILYGDPVLTTVDGNLVAAQAVILPEGS